MSPKIKPVYLLIAVLLSSFQSLEGKETGKMLTKDNYTLIDEPEAVTKYKLKKNLQGSGPGNKKTSAQTKIRIYDGDLHIDGDLWLDWPKAFEGKENQDGMIVTGNLDVTGNILNLEGGPFLLVLGNVKARNLVSTDGEIHIIGNADVSETIIGEYNDGVLYIDGKVKARLVINNDHCLELGQYSGPAFDPRRSVRCRYEGVYKWGEELADLKEFLVPEIKLEKDTVGFGDETEFDSVDVREQIFPRLRNGLSILKPASPARKK